MQNVAEMEAMALWQMRPCWGADAAAAAPPRLVARGGVCGGCVSTGDPGGCRTRAVKVRSQHASTRSRCPSVPLLRPCWLASSTTAGGNVSRLRLGMLSPWSRPPAKFERDSIVGTKKCFCILCAQVRGPGRVAGGHARAQGDGDGSRWL